jgi:hypothetical protein
MALYTLSARSIDGRVWWSGHGWSTDKGEAMGLDAENAQIVIERQRAANEVSKDIDDLINHFTVSFLQRRTNSSR